MEITTFADLLQNIEIIKKYYPGTYEELLREKICAQKTFSSFPHYCVGVKGFPQHPVATAKDTERE